MATFDNTYSRFVAWLKVVLPLSALAILSTVFLVSKRPDPESAIPYTEREVETILREQRVERPDYAGMTGDGTAITIAADSARPDSAERAQAEGLRATLETPDGVRTDLVAGHGTIDTGAQRAEMSGGVRIESSLGYVIETADVTTALDATDLRTGGRITGTGPLGRLDAGRMTLGQNGSADNPAYVLLFNDGVKLVYQPHPTQGGRE